MNKYNPKKHNRKSIRLKGYDYTQPGLYFITICCRHMTHLFGHIQNGEMKLNDAGKMIDAEWQNLPTRFPNTKLHAYIIMPNHFHSILEILPSSDDAPSSGNAAASGNASSSSNSPASGNASAPGDASTSGNASAPGDASSSGNAPASCIPPSSSDASAPALSSGIAPAPARATLVVAPHSAPHSAALGEIISAFKSTTTVHYIHGIKSSGWEPFSRKLWHRNYHERIIRDQQAYQNISNYIKNNPAKWTTEKFYMK